MKLDRSIKIQMRAYQNLRDIYSHAVGFGLTSQEINTRVSDMMTKFGPMPRWINSYIEGCRKVLTDDLYRNNLVFLFTMPDGSHVNTKIMPEGMSHRDVSEESISSGHYWIGRLDAIGKAKPFFVSEGR